jgi:sortase A
VRKPTRTEETAAMADASVDDLELPGTPPAGGADETRGVEATGLDEADEAAAYDDLPGYAMSPGRAVVRGIGETLITLGVLLLLLCVYQLWWTDVTSAQAITVARDEITSGWRHSGPRPTTVTSAGPSAEQPSVPDLGKGFALLYIPRLRDKVWGLPVLQGTTKDVLAQGAGHYEYSAMPGQTGNFAVAAHRSTHDEPFANFPDLRVGDKVYVQTENLWFVYTLTKDNPTLSPSDVWVVDPVPGQPSAVPKQKLITMTTCTPRYGSTGRWAWWGQLTATSKTTDPPPDGIDPTVT